MNLAARAKVCRSTAWLFINTVSLFSARLRLWLTLLPWHYTNSLLLIMAGSRSLLTRVPKLLAWLLTCSQVLGVADTEQKVFRQPVPALHRRVSMCSVDRKTVYLLVCRCRLQIGLLYDSQLFGRMMTANLPQVYFILFVLECITHYALLQA